MTDDFCYLTTTGRSTGRRHEIEIWYAADGTTLYLPPSRVTPLPVPTPSASEPPAAFRSGGGDRSDWVRNLRADPAVTVRLGDTTHPATARDDPAEDRRARTLVFDKYQPRYAGDLSRWREASLSVAVDLVREPPAP